MRIIAGLAKGTRLQAPPGRTARPSTDRLKEALFSILAPRLDGAAFLDLFAGCGGIGLEALSRGAAQAVFVEANPVCRRIIRENLAKTKLSGGEIFGRDVFRALPALKRQERLFQIIFFDPPYGQGLFGETLSALDHAVLLKKGGIIVGESDQKEEIPRELSKFCLVRQESYGESKLSFFYFKEDYL